MYKIGEFSKITSLSVKALRYYDEQNLLSPSERTDSGYRLYDDNDLDRAKIIRQLRSFDFSIAEIREAMRDFQDEEDLEHYFTVKKDFIADNIERQKALIETIDRHLTIK